MNFFKVDSNHPFDAIFLWNILPSIILSHNLYLIQQIKLPNCIFYSFSLVGNFKMTAFILLTYYLIVFSNVFHWFLYDYQIEDPLILLMVSQQLFWVFLHNFYEFEYRLNLSSFILLIARHQFSLLFPIETNYSYSFFSLFKLLSYRII